MSTYHPVSSVPVPARAAAPLSRLWAELSALSDALLSPGSIIAQVKEFQSLHRQADRLEASDPARAAMLRQRASRVLA